MVAGIFLNFEQSQAVSSLYAKLGFSPLNSSAGSNTRFQELVEISEQL